LVKVFVSRDKELGQLESFLGKAIAGQGQVCFVTDEFGFAKTSLTLEFAQRAQQRHRTCWSRSATATRRPASASGATGDPEEPFCQRLS
jgi:adenylate cyclase